MENNDSNIKPQSTSGLKLMTVFVVVLALHVVVIGGITAYYVFKGSGSSSDADVLADKLHKTIEAAPESTAASDSTAPDTNTTSPANPTDVTSMSPAPVAPMVVNDNGGTPTVPDTTTTPDTTATPAVPVASTAPAETSATPAPTTPSATDTSVTPPTIPVTPASSMTSVVTPAIANPLTPPADPTPAPAAAPAPEVASTAATPYVVKHGDVLERIAHQNHITVAKLKEANNLSSDFLHIGQKLVIPAATPKTTVATTATPAASTDKAAPAKPTVAPEAKNKDTAISLKPKKNKTIIASTNSKPGYYTVVKGDNLTKIAHKFKTTPNAIMTANNLSDPKKLSIGTKLKIPSREARSAKNVEPSDKTVKGQASTAPVATPAKMADTQATDSVIQPDAGTQLANVTQ